MRMTGDMLCFCHLFLNCHRIFRMSFGWYRAEVLGAIVSVLMIWVITAILVYWAIIRCLTHEFEVDARVMLITSAIAILVNIL